MGSNVDVDLRRHADDDFADPPDIRFPGQFEDMRKLDMDLSRLARETYMAPTTPPSEASEPESTPSS